MVGLMIVFGLVIDRLNPTMASMMFRSDGPLGLGLWGIMIVPLAVMLLMMGAMFFLFRPPEVKSAKVQTEVLSREKFILFGIMR